MPASGGDGTRGGDSKGTRGPIQRSLPGATPTPDPLVVSHERLAALDTCTRLYYLTYLATPRDVATRPAVATHRLAQLRRVVSRDEFYTQRVRVLAARLLDAGFTGVAADFDATVARWYEEGEAIVLWWRSGLPWRRPHRDVGAPLLDAAVYSRVDREAARMLCEEIGTLGELLTTDSPMVELHDGLIEEEYPPYRPLGSIDDPIELELLPAGDDGAMPAVLVEQPLLVLHSNRDNRIVALDVTAEPLEHVSRERLLLVGLAAASRHCDTQWATVESLVMHLGLGPLEEASVAMTPDAMAEARGIATSGAERLRAAHASRTGKEDWPMRDEDKVCAVCRFRVLCSRLPVTDADTTRFEPQP